jgi:hypothetical protein
MVSPVAGRARTPALTSDDWIVPFTRNVDTTTGPRSWLDRDAASCRVVVSALVMTTLFQWDQTTRHPHR